ncbi:hypothetical protein [Ulvibacterium marinum]|uniref:hypothetical protein n=1 Tax=Ulvibacterium marinum TaxID=2419782 RepID=UPI0024953D96|nr:hypothetical protein [Ulvibacterium marinum]
MPNFLGCYVFLLGLRLASIELFMSIHSICPFYRMGSKKTYILQLQIPDATTT